MSKDVVSGWRVATYTGGQGNCVEVGRSATTIAVRDTKTGRTGRSWASILPRGACSRSASRVSPPFRRTGPPYGGCATSCGGLSCAVPDKYSAFPLALPRLWFPASKLTGGCTRGHAIEGHR